MSYGCHNMPRPTAGAPLQVQDGYHRGIFDYEDGSSDRVSRMVTVPFVMSTACQYTQGHPADPGCSGCRHQSKDAA